MSLTQKVAAPRLAAFLPFEGWALALDDRPLLIVGASARAAAASARRAGYSPIAVDRFADRDLDRIARVLDVPPGADLLDVVAALPPCEWMYTGGMENEPDLVDAISRRHRLLGNPGRVLRRVRDPEAWTSALRDAGLPCPEIVTRGMTPDRRKSWICKSLRSIGGLSAQAHDGAAIPDGDFLQERVEGELHGAQFRVSAERTQFLGACAQWVGGPGAPSPFAYRASLGPATFGDELRTQLQRIGEVLTEAFGLSGLFGVDFILDPDGLAWPIEINPRYTAAIEILELAESTLSALSDDLGSTCDCLSLRKRGPDGPGMVRLSAGKCVIYAEQALTWRGFEIPEGIADIPREGTVFRPGDPILTVLAQSAEPSGVAQNLLERVESWRRRFGFLT